LKRRSPFALSLTQARRRLFLEAIHIAGAASISAVGSLHEANQTSETVAKMTGSVFASVFQEIERAGKESYEEPDEVDNAGDPEFGRCRSRRSPPSRQALSSERAMLFVWLGQGWAEGLNCPCPPSWPGSALCL